MKIKPLIVSVVLFLSFQNVFAQVEKQIVQIRNQVNLINRNLKTYAKKTQQVEDISLEGTEATFYTSGRGLHKIRALIGGETYNAVADLYYRGEELIFAYSKLNRYDTQIGLDVPPKVVRTEEKRMYFAGGRMIKLLVGKYEVKKGNKQWLESEKDIRELSRQLKIPNKNSAAPVSLKSKPCLSYEPETATLRGLARRKTFLNASNEKEIVWILKLDAPVCLDADPENEMNERRKGVTEVQLVLSAEQYKQYRIKLGRKVQASGKLFGGHTQHHFTEVLMIVEEIKNAAN